MADREPIRARPVTSAVRVYRPAGDGPFGVLVWYHGGGWVIGDLDTARPALPRSSAHGRGGRGRGRLPARARAPLPGRRSRTAWAALDWVAANAAELGGRPERLAVGGDSAGRQPRRARRAPRLATRAARDSPSSSSIYPATDLDDGAPVHQGER